MAPSARVEQLVVLERVGSREATDAVLSVSPDDRATIVAGSIGESMWTSIYGLITTRAVLASAALGATIGSLVTLDRGERLLPLSGGIFAVLALVHGLGAARLVSITHVFRAIAVASPTERSRVMVMATEGLAVFRELQLVLLVLLAVVVAAGTLLLRRTPSAARLLVLGGAGGLLGIGSLTGVTAMAASDAAPRFAALSEPVLMDGEGFSTSAPEIWIDATGVALPTLGKGERPTRGAVSPWLRRLMTDHSVLHGARLPIGVARDARAEVFWSLLGTRRSITPAGRARPAGFRCGSEGTPGRHRLRVVVRRPRDRHPRNRTGS